MPHHRQDLEAAILNLQFGPYSHRVRTILDRHLSKLPRQSQQDESDKLWRLALHRMDLRQYTVSDTSGSESPGGGADTGESAKRYLQLEPNALDADLQAMVDESTAGDRSYECQAWRPDVGLSGLRAQEWQSRPVSMARKARRGTHAEPRG